MGKQLKPSSEISEKNSDDAVEAELLGHLELLLDYDLFESAEDLEMLESFSSGESEVDNETP